MKKYSYLLKLLFICFLLLTTNACTKYSTYNLPSSNANRVYTGLERFVATKAFRYKGKKAALITNHSGVNYKLEQNINLIKAEGINITALFAPEHGIYGHQEEYSNSLSLEDKSSRLKIFNMHKLNNYDFKKILLKNKIVIFDIQDMGMRCYTYISNLKRVMDLLSKSKVELIVLDRPNPIAPFGIDGFDLNKNFSSRFISSFPAPFIYGFTIGEAARYYNGEFKKKLKLTVIPMKNYDKNLLFSQTGQPWVPPSPNLPSFRSAIIYTCVVLMEGINLSIGRGTANPFEYIGAPWIDPVSFSKTLNKLKIKNFIFRPIYFTPKYSKYKDEQCGGVQIFYTGGSFSATEVSYKIIAALIKKYPQAVEWKSYKNKYWTDYLAGTDKFRNYLLQGKSFQALKPFMLKSRKIFNKKMRNYYLYN